MPARRATAGTALEARQSRNLPQAPSRRLRSAIRRPRHRLGPELTNIPQLPACRDCPMPHSSWHRAAAALYPKASDKGQRAGKGQRKGAKGKGPILKGQKAPPSSPSSGFAMLSLFQRKGCHPPPARRPPPPSKLRKGRCGRSRPHRCWPRRAGRNCWNTSGSAHRSRAGSSPRSTSPHWSATPSWSSSSRPPRTTTMPIRAACWTTAWRSSPMR